MSEIRLSNQSIGLHENCVAFRTHRSTDPPSTVRCNLHSLFNPIVGGTGNQFRDNGCPAGQLHGHEFEAAM